MVDDDISAGSQDEEMTRHHSSSLRGPRPRPSDTPPPSKRLRHPHPPTLPTPWGSDKDSAVTTPVLAAPLAPAETDADADEPVPEPAVLSGGTVPPPFGLPDEHPTRANEPTSSPTPRALATRRRPGKRTKERAMRKHLHDQAEHNPLGTAATP